MRRGYLNSRLDGTGTGKATVAQHRQQARERLVCAGAERFSNAQAWEILRARGLGAERRPYTIKGHLVSRRKAGVQWHGPAPRLVYMWFIFRVRDGKLIWASRQVDLSRVVAHLLLYVRRHGTKGLRPIPYRKPQPQP